MAPHLQWPDLLEEETYLVQMVSETRQDSGALEQTTNTLEVLRTDLHSCASDIAALKKDIKDNNIKESTPSSSTASRFFHRISASISSDHSHEEEERRNEVQNERLLDATTKERTLRIEIKNLEDKFQILRCRTRHHEELKHRLTSLYNRAFDGSNSSSPEEDEAEEEVRKAQQTLHHSQKVMERHRTLTALLGYGDFALSTAGPHLLTAVSSGSKGADSTVFQTEVIAAKTCAVHAYIVIDQAKRLDPIFFEREKSGDVFNQNWLSSIFRTQPTGSRDAQYSPSQQALQSHHTALLSLLSLARKKWQEYETNLRRAAQWHMEAYGRKQMVRKRVLLKYAGIQEDRSLEDTEGSRGGLLRMRDLTVGLDKFIAVVAPSRLPTAPSAVSEERRGTGAKEGKLLLPRDQSLVRSPDIAPLPTQPRPLTPNSMQPSGSNPSSETRTQRSPGLHPDAIAHQRQSPSGSPSRPQPAEARAGPQARDVGSRGLRPSLENIPGEMRSQGGYGISRPQPSLPAPESLGESQAHEVRPIPQPQPLSTVYSRNRAPSASTDAPVLPHPLPVQSPPSTNFRAEDVGLHANHGQTLPDIPQSRSITSATQPTKGILKAPMVTPQPPPTDLTDPWGVKIASAAPSRPRPKLKTMIGMLRGVDGFKSDKNSDSRKGSGPVSDLHPPGLPVKEVVRAPSTSRGSNEWTSVRKLRFSEAVAMIPRPAVDSDPYEDEDDDYMPPSPMRGSMLWRTDEEEEEIESEEGGNSRSTAFSARGPIQIDPVPRNREATDGAATGSLAAYSSEDRGIYSRAPALHPSGLDVELTFAGPSTSQRQNAIAISQNAVLNPSEVLARQRSRQLPLEHSGGDAGARHGDQGDRQRMGPVAASRAYPEQSRAPRPLPETGIRVSSDDMHVESRRILAIPEDVRGRLMSPSDPNLAASSQVTPRKPPPLAPPMTRGGLETRSDHDLVQTMFPSPRSTVAEHDLLFTN